jgi:hypothetical protein
MLPRHTVECAALQVKSGESIGIFVESAGGTWTEVPSTIQAGSGWCGQAECPLAHEQYLARFRSEGTVLKGRVWAEAATEPSTWSIISDASAQVATTPGWLGVATLGSDRLSMIRIGWAIAGGESESLGTAFVALTLSPSPPPAPPVAPALLEHDYFDELPAGTLPTGWRVSDTNASNVAVADNVPTSAGSTVFEMESNGLQHAGAALRNEAVHTDEAEVVALLEASSNQTLVLCANGTEPAARSAYHFAVRPRALYAVFVLRSPSSLPAPPASVSHAAASHG